MSQLIIQSGNTIRGEKKQFHFIRRWNFKQVEQKPEVFDTTSSYQVDVRGMIDIHVNCGKGTNILEGTAQALQAIAEFHLRHGTTSMILTIISSSRS